MYAKHNFDEQLYYVGTTIRGLCEDNNVYKFYTLHSKQGL